MLFSFHLDTEAPRKLENGLFDCSLPHYTSFKQHLECNLELECQNGEDEENCPFSSPACNGSVAFNNKCYTSVKSDLFLSWNGADAECKSRGGNLAVMTSQGEWDAVEKIFQYGRSWAPAYVGFRRVDATMPGMYSKMWMWSDRTLAYSVDIDYANLQELFEYGCGFISPELPRQLRATLCSISGAKHFVCEMVVEEEEVPSPRESVTSPDLRLSRFTRLPVIGCPGGHMTHDFLSCDLNSACGGEGRSKTCNVPAKYDAISDDDRPDVVTVGLFMCDDDETTLPYTLVCDYRVDDDKQFPGIVRCLPSPTVISFDGRGNFTQLPAKTKHEALLSVDLSRTLLQEFDSKVFSSFQQVKFLNISHGSLQVVTGNGFSFLPRLVELDVSGSPVEDFPNDLFFGLSQLETVFADNYKICCKDTLPQTFDPTFCFAASDEISSCEDLLRSDLYRGCFWMFAALAVFGNVVCFVFRFLSRERKSKSGFNVFVTNLSLADTLMGVYLVIVGVADQLYRGNYLWNEKAWKRSTACRSAGFLALLSSEMSAFIICLITLDRFIVIRFPFSSFRFRRWSAAVACGIAWLLGLALAALPLLSVTSSWEFYGQTGICIPLPITRNSF
nr:hypothetical protein BaRGS_034094 [Batillaria attramentaria]